MQKMYLECASQSLYKKTIANGNWFFIAILILLVTRLTAAILYSNLGPYADEDNYVSRGIYFWKMLTEENPELKENYINQFYYDGYWPPLFSIIIYPFYSLADYEGVRVFLSIVDIISGFLLYKIAKKASNQETANLTLLLYALNPFIWVASFSVLSEGMFNFFLFLFLLIYLNFIESNNFNTRKMTIYGILLGTSMAAAIHVRSAFILVFIVVSVISIFILPKKNKLPTFIFSGALMLVLTIPWNIFILKQEGKFMFMHTISTQQFYMKFVDRSGGWNSIKDRLSAESSKLGVSPSELASQRTEEYFKDTPSFLDPINVMINDFRNSYLFGISDHENRLRVGFFKSEGGLLSLNWLTTIYHEITRMPLIVFGLLAIVFPIGFLKYREVFIGLLIGTASVGILGLTWGRHLVNLMPFLVLGTAVFITYAIKNFSAAYLSFSFVIATGLGMLGINIWQNQDGSNWSKPFEQHLIWIGKKHTISDQLQLRKLDNCVDTMTLDDPQNEWSISIQSIIDPNSTPITVSHGQTITVSDFIQISIKPRNPGKNLNSVHFIASSGKGELRLDGGRTTEEWRSINNTCIKYKR